MSQISISLIQKLNEKNWVVDVGKIFFQNDCHQTQRISPFRKLLVSKSTTDMFLLSRYTKPTTKFYNPFDWSKKKHQPMTKKQNNVGCF